MIKLILLTGFLGTGKTTLLTAMLDSYSNEKIGVIVNEFGEVSIDGLLIERDGIKMKELSNGSIFCACIKENFLKSLITMSNEDIDYVFIEASGLADPASMLQIVQVISSKTIKQYDYKGSVCVIDAETFLDYYDLLPALHQQVVYSGAVIVNKVDLVNEEELLVVLDKLTSINQEATIHVTSYCKVDFRQMINELSLPGRISTESSNTVETRPKTFVLSAEVILPFEALEILLKGLASSAYRIKGFAKTTKGDVFISAVKNHIDITPWKYSIKDTEIVLISAVGIRLMSLITEGLKGELHGKLHI